MVLVLQLAVSEVQTPKPISEWSKVKVFPAVTLVTHVTHVQALDRCMYIRRLLDDLRWRLNRPTRFSPKLPLPFYSACASKLFVRSLSPPPSTHFPPQPKFSSNALQINPQTQIQNSPNQNYLSLPSHFLSAPYPLFVVHTYSYVTKTVSLT